MGTATGCGGALGWHPTILIVAQPWKEERVALMIRTTLATLMMRVMTLNGDGYDAITEEGV
jgi:hypothetical protein